MGQKVGCVAVSYRGPTDPEDSPPTEDERGKLLCMLRQSGMGASAVVW